MGTCRSEEKKKQEQLNQLGKKGGEEEEKCTILHKFCERVRRVWS